MKRGLTIVLMLLLCLFSEAQDRRMYLCAGQSNARGRGDTSLTLPVLSYTAFEYSFKGDSLRKLVEPIGENWWGFQTALTGSIWSSFSRKYNSLSGDTVLIIPGAKGGSTLHPDSWGSSSWGNPGTLFNRAKSKTHAAQNFTGKNLDGIIWLQGENDGISLNWGLISQQDYEDQLRQMIGRFRVEFGCKLNFYIIQTGLWAGYNDSGFVAIRAAQANVAATDIRTHIVYDSTIHFPAMGYMFDPVHYNQTGLNRIGLSIANRIYDIENEKLVQIDSLGFAEICDGDQMGFSLSKSSPYFGKYIWSNGDIGSSATFTQSGPVFVTAIDTSGCDTVYSDTLFLTVNQLPPVPKITTSSGDTAFCAGDTLTLSGPSGYQAYAWNSGNISQSLQTTQTQVWSLQVTDAKGCQSPVSISLTSLQLPLPPKPTVSYLTDSLCIGDSLVLNAPSGYAIYQWNNGNTLSGNTIWSAGNYSFHVTDSYNCVSPESDTISVTQLTLPNQPTLSQYQDTTLCSHDSITVSAPPGFAQYHWINQSNLQSILVDQPELVSVRVIDQYGCRSPYSDTVNISKYAQIPEPQFNFVGDSLFCDGDSVIISGQAGFAIYDWSNGTSTQSNTIKVSGSYQLTVSNVLGCYSLPSRLLPVVVWSLPAQPSILTSTGDTLICAGDTLQLTANPANSGYLWSSGDTTPNLLTTVSQSYTVSVLDANGCESPASPPLVTNAVPTPAKPLLSYTQDSICTGDSLVLNAPVGFTAYHWNDGNSVAEDTIWTAGSYFFSLENIYGCISAESDTILVTELNLPLQPILSQYNDTVLCSYDSMALSAPAGWSNYHWNTQQNTQAIKITQAGTFYVRVIDQYSCRSPYSDSVNISFYAQIPKPQLSFSNDTTLCQGDSVTIFSPAGFAIYNWSNGFNQKDIVIDSPGSYRVQATDSNGCSSPFSRIVPVIVNPLPPQPWLFTSTGDTLICAGDTLDLLSPAGFAFYNWSNGETTQNIQVTQSGTFTVSVVDGNGCESPLSASVTTNAVPTPAKPAISYNGQDSICYGDSLVLTAVSGFTAIHWNDGGSQLTDSIRNPGSYYFNLENQFGCISENSDTVTVTVLSLPPKPILSQLNDTIICPHDTLHIYAPANYATYHWINSASTQSVAVNQLGKYSVRTIDQFGCRSPYSDTISVSLYTPIAKPQPSINVDSLFCTGDSVILSAPGGFSIYSWSNGAMSQSQVINSPGNYSVVVTDQIGCHSPPSRAVPIVVWPLPPQPLVGPASLNGICPGQSLSLLAPGSYAGYIWSDGSSQANLTVDSTGFWWVQTIDGNGCISPNSDTVKVEVHPALPKANIVVIGNPILCQGEFVILAAPGGYAGYHWSDGATYYRDTIYNPGYYSLFYEDVNGCLGPVSDSVQIQVNPVPAQPGAGPAGPHNGCQGDTIWLSSPNSGYPIYNWGGGYFGQTVGITQSGNYSLFVIDTNNCSSPTATPILINLSPIPAKPSISFQGQGILICNQIATSYQWFFNGQAIAGATNSTLSMGQPGSYQVQVFDGACPSDTSFPYLTVGIESQFETTFSLYPNPSSGNFTLDFGNPLNSPGMIEITDAWGRKIHKKELKTSDQRINFNLKLAGGFYFIRIWNGYVWTIKSFQILE